MIECLQIGYIDGNRRWLASRIPPTEIAGQWAAIAKILDVAVSWLLK